MIDYKQLAFQTFEVAKKYNVDYRMIVRKICYQYEKEEKSLEWNRDNFFKELIKIKEEQNEN